MPKHTTVFFLQYQQLNFVGSNAKLCYWLQKNELVVLPW